MDTIELDPGLRHADSSLGLPPPMLIDSRLVPAASGETFEAYNPMTTAIIPNSLEADRTDVDLAESDCPRARSLWT